MDQYLSIFSIMEFYGNVYYFICFKYFPLALTYIIFHVVKAGQHKKQLVISYKRQTKKNKDKFDTEHLPLSSLHSDSAFAHLFRAQGTVSVKNISYSLYFVISTTKTKKGTVDL